MRILLWLLDIRTWWGFLVAMDVRVLPPIAAILTGTMFGVDQNNRWASWCKWFKNRKQDGGSDAEASK